MAEQEKHVTKMNMKKSTGIQALDRRLGGGLPNGSVVLFRSSPRSMSEIFLYYFATAQKAYYFATDRGAKYIKQNISDFGLNTDNISFIDIYNEYRKNIGRAGDDKRDEMILAYFSAEIEKLRKNKDFVCVIDTYSFFLELDVGHGRIRELLDQIYDMTKETNSVSYLYVLKGIYEDKIVEAHSNTCDVIFDIESERVGENMYNRLIIPKIRGIFPVPTQFIKYQIIDGIQIDTSMYIA
ncbi:MAG: RAD55 family ATPase [Methanocellales archaeon]|nr:RAD55 family ATPase [Methanocellales archaeon]